MVRSIDEKAMLFLFNPRRRTDMMIAGLKLPEQIWWLGFDGRGLPAAGVVVASASQTAVCTQSEVV